MPSPPGTAADSPPPSEVPGVPRAGSSWVPSPPPNTQPWAPLSGGVAPLDSDGPLAVPAAPVESPRASMASSTPPPPGWVDAAPSSPPPRLPSASPQPAWMEADREASPRQQHQQPAWVMEQFTPAGIAAARDAARREEVRAARGRLRAAMRLTDAELDLVGFESEAEALALVGENLHVAAGWPRAVVAKVEGWYWRTRYRRMAAPKAPHARRVVGAKTKELSGSGGGAFPTAPVRWYSSEAARMYARSSDAHAHAFKESYPRAQSERRADRVPHDLTTGYEPPPQGWGEHAQPRYDPPFCRIPPAHLFDPPAHHARRAASVPLAPPEPKLLSPPLPQDPGAAPSPPRGSAAPPDSVVV
eukprot:TRINITY_DN12058_c0_g1_i1.p1 TRINITY_DN12058_c0_g1~~TRINITY_DN12058_c0_g1_i1.p1  ORF type:complete len:359 (+),score=111.52 TRINITY_DN12058_c0_g1_i1:53-1129(+)